MVISEEKISYSNMITNRDSLIDILRGMAMLLVVLGHTMTGSSLNSENSFLFNVIWALQMPMFILISGYVNKYSRPLSDFSGLMNYVKRRTVSYLLPWCVWTIIIRGILFKESNFINIKYLMFNMDSGYWFLSTIWTISMAFGFASFFAKKLCKNSGEIRQQIVQCTLYIVSMAMLGLMAIFCGISFLGLKLTLYYMPFYYLGFIFGKVNSNYKDLKTFEQLKSVTIAVSLIIWIGILVRINLYDLPDNACGIVLRAASSLVGCIAICGLLQPIFSSTDSIKQMALKKENKNGTILDSISIFLKWAGIHSLEIYLSHSLVTNLLKMHSVPSFGSIDGVILVFGNYGLTIVLLVVIVSILNANKHLSYILFGKTK